MVRFFSHCRNWRSPLCDKECLETLPAVNQIGELMYMSMTSDRYSSYCGFLGSGRVGLQSEC